MSPAVNRTFLTREVAKLCRVTVRALQVWRDARLLRPAMEGKTCVYTERDLRAARMVRDLRRKHLSTAAIRRILPQAAKHETGYLLIHRKRRETRYAAKEQDILELATKAGDGVLLLDLGAAELEVVPRDPANDRYPTDLPLPLLAELVFMLREVGEEDLARAARNLDNPASGEKVLGALSSPETMQLWALQHKCDGRANSARQKAEYESVSAADAEQARCESVRWRDLGNLVRVLFWIQANDDLGDEAWCAEADGKTLGVRTAYKIVAFERKNPMAQFMGQFGGGS